MRDIWTEFNNVALQMNAIEDKKEVIVLGLLAFKKLSEEVFSSLDCEQAKNLTNVNGIDVYPSMKLNAWQMCKMTKAEYILFKKLQ